MQGPRFRLRHVLNMAYLLLAVLPLVACGTPSSVPARTSTDGESKSLERLPAVAGRSHLPRIGAPGRPAQPTAGLGTEAEALEAEEDLSLFAPVGTPDARALIPRSVNVGPASGSPFESPPSHHISLRC